MPTHSYDEMIEKLMEDPEEAVGYLTEALKDSPEVFLVALRHVATSQGNMTKLAEEANVSRRALYQMLSEEGNPTFLNISSVLDTLGIEVSFKLKLEGTEVG